MHHSIIHIDDSIIVVNKPHGCLSVPGLSTSLNLFDRIKNEFPNARTVHRLDMATSGIILFALSYETQVHLSRQFEQKLVKKCYQALVAGRVPDLFHEIELPLGSSPHEKTRHRVDIAGGKFARTLVEVLAASASCTRLKLYPYTGRSHQLRVHCQAIGHPIVGDRFYGDPHGANRMMLHAQSIELVHPGLNKWVEFTSPCPF